MQMQSIYVRAGGFFLLKKNRHSNQNEAKRRDEGTRTSPLHISAMHELRDTDANKPKSESVDARTSTRVYSPHVLAYRPRVTG